MRITILVLCLLCLSAAHAAQTITHPPEIYYQESTP